jgi:hypothetical protein
VHRGCDQEPHLNWWRFSGLKMLLQIELRYISEDLGLPSGLGTCYSFLFNACFCVCRSFKVVGYIFIDLNSSKSHAIASS